MYKLKRILAKQDEDNSIRDQYAHRFMKLRAKYSLTVNFCANLLGITPQQYKDLEQALTSFSEHDYVSYYNWLGDMLMKEGGR